jgi:hypothetical protein
VGGAPLSGSDQTSFLAINEQTSSATLNVQITDTATGDTAAAMEMCMRVPTAYGGTNTYRSVGTGSRQRHNITVSRITNVTQRRVHSGRTTEIVVQGHGFFSSEDEYFQKRGLDSLRVKFAANGCSNDLDIEDNVTLSQRGTNSVELFTNIVLDTGVWRTCLSVNDGKSYGDQMVDISAIKMFSIFPSRVAFNFSTTFYLDASIGYQANDQLKIVSFEDDCSQNSISGVPPLINTAFNAALKRWSTNITFVPSGSMVLTQLKWCLRLHANTDNHWQTINVPSLFL